MRQNAFLSSVNGLRSAVHLLGGLGHGSNRSQNVGVFVGTFAAFGGSKVECQLLRSSSCFGRRSRHEVVIWPGPFWLSGGCRFVALLGLLHSVNLRFVGGSLRRWDWWT